jgi:hypothetical protein
MIPGRRQATRHRMPRPNTPMCSPLPPLAILAILAPLALALARLAVLEPASTPKPLAFARGFLRGNRLSWPGPLTKGRAAPQRSPQWKPPGGNGRGIPRRGPQRGTGRPIGGWGVLRRNRTRAGDGKWATGSQPGGSDLCRDRPCSGSRERQGSSGCSSRLGREGRVERGGPGRVGFGPCQGQGRRDLSGPERKADGGQNIVQPQDFEGQG